jgi:hypothetical protein
MAAALMAVVEPSSMAAVALRPWLSRASVSTSRVPDPGSRNTNGVAASSCAEIGRRRLLQG